MTYRTGPSLFVSAQSTHLSGPTPILTIQNDYPTSPTRATTHFDYPIPNCPTRPCALHSRSHLPTPLLYTPLFARRIYAPSACTSLSSSSDCPTQHHARLNTTNHMTPHHIASPKVTPLPDRHHCTIRRYSSRNDSAA